MVLRALGLTTVLWLGGMSGVGKTTAARAFALEHDLWLYSLDARTYEHDDRMPRDPRTLDERWVDSTPEELADWFEDYARRRFPLVREDLEAVHDGAPVLVDGAHILPELVSGNALFIVARPDLQRDLVINRGSDLYARTRDPRRALANRLGRDVVLAERIRSAPADVVEISAVAETLEAVESRFLPAIGEWIANQDHGDVVARRRYDEDARTRQRQAHAAATRRSD